jgi:protein SCO1/2
VAGQTPARPAGPVAGGAATGARWPGRRLTAALAAAAVLVLVAAAVVVIVIRHHQQATLGQVRPAGIPASVPTSLADLMILSPVPASPAPAFRLTDQDGQPIRLSQFRGKVVVLTFFDPHCVDTCPLIAQEFADAYHDLGAAAGRVVFAAVNVNPYHARVRDVLAFSREHQLTTIPDWHFVTGSVAALKKVWMAYNVEVQAPGPNADVVHTSVDYFITPGGVERFVATPMAGERNGKGYLPGGTLAAWGRGIALVARSLAR